MKTENNFDYTTIKTFEDACAKLGVDSTKLPNTDGILEKMAKPIIAGYKLMVIYKAINDGWKPDWSNYNEFKYYPWFEVLSSGFGFSDSAYYYELAITAVGSRLCTNTKEKALYIAETFKKEYEDYFF